MRGGETALRLPRDFAEGSLGVSASSADEDVLVPAESEVLFGVCLLCL